MQVSLQHITAPGRKKAPCTGVGLLSMGLPRLVSSSCLSPYVPGSAPRPGHWTLDTGHWTLDTPPPPQDPDPWRLPAPAPRVQTAAYRADD